jgi:predicted GIY-YIG superfamily endonuclease
MITNITNSKCYIGQSIDIEKRWKQHKHTSTYKKSKIYKFFELVNKGVIDLYCKNKWNVWSMTTIEKQKELDEYIARLRKKYNIKIIEINIRGDEYYSKTKSKALDDLIDKLLNTNKCFKTIKATRKGDILKGKFEKEKQIHILLDVNKQLT